MSESLLLRVKRVYSQNPRGFGGAIFACSQIDDRGDVLNASSLVTVHASGRVLAGIKVQAGQWWEVRGCVRAESVDLNGYRIVEQRLRAEEATLRRPSGEHIVSLMAESAAFEGIGWVKARRLWETFGERLYQILDAGDLATLSTQLSPPIAKTALSAWSLYGDTRTLVWLQAQGFDVALGRKVTQFFGAETAARIEQDPYRLLSFCATWKQVDELARTQFKVGADDPRRLQGAIEEACYRLFAEGHTLVPVSTLKNTLLALVGPRSRDDEMKWHALVSDSLNLGLNNGSFVIAPAGVQPLGAKVMETVVARALSERIDRGTEPRLLLAPTVDRYIGQYEAREALVLNEEQRAAIHLANDHAFACITGGAGVGKTTVLKALYEIYDAAGIQVVQIALAGRAAKRMHEATGRGATTIASFLRNYREGDLAAPCAVVIDEASMADIISMSCICELLPPHVRLLLVGDPNQLMPVGPGLVLHTVVTVPQTPVVELKVVKRHGDEIRQAAAQVRDGRWPALPEDATANIAFLHCATDETTLAETVFRLYEQDPSNTQILSAHRRGAGGTAGLNALCQSRLTSHDKPLTVWNEMRDCDERAGFHVGDIVLCTRNRWDRGLQNGSLGKIVSIEDGPPRQHQSDSEEPIATLGWVQWDDGECRSLPYDLLDDLELGYAITVHKAQGSQWPRVIVPVRRHRLLDRTLLYTAVTRAQRQVLLVGDAAAARAAVEERSRAATRLVALDQALERMLQGPTALPLACRSHTN